MKQLNESKFFFGFWNPPSNIFSIDGCNQREECPEVSELYDKADTETDTQLKAAIIAQLKSKVCEE